MKLGQLKSLGHNIADSFASGIGLMIGVYDMDVFSEAAASDPGHIEVNFLDASTSGSPVSPKLKRALALYRAALTELSARHGINVNEIQSLSARFGTDSVYGPYFTVTVATVDGRRSADQYVGFPAMRLRTAKG
jgi:hypothetical protein